MAKNSGNNIVTCSFCGKTNLQVRRIISGPGVFICNECIDLCNSLMEETEGRDVPRELTSLPKPKDIAKELSDYVIEQEDAKKSLAVAVYNHYKRIRYLDSRSGRKSKENVEIQKSNILMLGPTGSG